ncbi:hypothetical protein [Halorubrum sp. SD612]|uniref:hypothetical protein n=1 Tax=Halorubrum sp. SD612 TaxID=1855863 RepID=UPI001179A0C1|nr:hypothetical protein [Halorubrum sp. SD612]
MKRTLVAALAVMLLLAPVVPFAAVGSAAAAPGGMATIPDGNVAEDVPDGETLALSASELEGSVLASDHADSLEVILTTADHAPTVMDGDTASVTGDGMAVVLRDDTESAGREVALDAGKLREALGYRPRAIHGTHEDGSEWTGSAEYVDGYLVFDVPHFSDNTVTFSGRVDVSMNSATSGTTATWQLSAYDAASDVTINTTGVENTAPESTSTASALDGDTIPLSVGGTKQPRDETVTFSGAETTTKQSDTGSRSSSGSHTIAVGGNQQPRDAQINIDSVGKTTYQTVEYVIPNGDQVYLESDGASYTSTISNSGQKKIDSITISEFYYNTGYNGEDTVGLELYINGDMFGEIEYNSDKYYVTKHDFAGSKTVSGDYTITIKATAGIGEPYGYINRGTGESSATWDIEGTQPGSVSVESQGQTKTLQSGESASLPLQTGSNSLTFSGSGVSDLSWSASWTEVTQTENPGLSVGGSSASHTGILSPGETVTEPVDLSTGSQSADVSVTGPVDVSVSWTEASQTRDPVVELNGQTTTIHSGTLADGETATATIPKDQLQQGTNTLNVSLGDGSLSADAPEMRADIEASHEASDKISVGYSATTFEESYNVSHTYAAETSDAQVTIPFESSRVVGVKNVEYQIGGGGWERVGADNYRFDGTTVDVYVSDAVGGTVPAGSTVDVRATGRKMSVGNGAVTITDPTAPHEELDTQLRIDERSEDFHVNVGPTDDGDRVHYSYSDIFPTEDYVVIDSSGAQKMYLPNSKTGDTFRVKHLETRVIAQQGDVRIDVVEPGQNPELDVSPGPGGDGDPVTIEYYNTESGVEYLLNSLKRSIVVDSDVAQSPAIFEDDDSEDTWQILRDSEASVREEDSDGPIGQFRERAGAAVGSVSTPSGVGGGQLLLLGLLGLGGVVVFRRVEPFGGRGVEVGKRIAQKTGSGAFSGLQGLLSYMSRVVNLVVSNRRASIATGVLAAIVAARAGLLRLPEGAGILIVVSGVPIASYLVLRRSDAVSQRVWLASTLVAVVLGLEFVAPGTIQTAIEQLTSEQVAPLLILVVAGGVYLWYRARQSDRPVFNVVTRRE